MSEEIPSFEELRDNAFTSKGSKLQEMHVMSQRPHNEFRFFRNHEYAREPEKAHESDAGYDLCSCEYYKIEPKQWQIVRTGVQFDIPAGWEIQIRPRSGLAAKKGITVLNTPGTIDCFTEDCKIKTVEGDKFIKDIGINEIVFSLDEESGEMVKNKILCLVDTGEQEVLKISTDDGVIEVTSNTLVYTKDGIKNACDLTCDDYIIVF